MQATLTLYGGELLPYYLHEETGWSLDINELREQTYKVTRATSPLYLIIAGASRVRLSSAIPAPSVVFQQSKSCWVNSGMLSKQNISSPC